LLIQVGENEILFDDSTRLRDVALAAGVDTTFRPWPHGIHVWPVFISAGIPESALAIEHLARFFRLHARSDTAEEAGLDHAVRAQRGTAAVATLPRG
jgi:acetyl esterase/lipase